MSDPQTDAAELDELRALWRAEPAHDRAPIDLDAVRKRADRFTWKVRLRNAMEWGAAVLVVVSFSRMAAGDELPTLSRVAAVWTALSAVFVSLWLVRYGRIKRLPDPTQHSLSYVDAYRDNLLRQAALLKSAPLWYFLPLGIGVLGVQAGVFLEVPGALASKWPSLVFSIGLFVVLIAVNVVAAAKLRKQAESLQDADDESTSAENNTPPKEKV